MNIAGKGTLLEYFVSLSMILSEFPELSIELDHADRI
jgi:hypothetical protein